MLAEEGGDFGGGAFVVDGKLWGGALTGGRRQLGGVEIDAASFDGQVEIVGSGPGVSAGLGVRSGRHVSDPEGQEGVAQPSRFAGR